MASLMTDVSEQDLFGDVPIDDPPLAVAAPTLHVPVAAPATNTVAAPTSAFASQIGSASGSAAVVTGAPTQVPTVLLPTAPTGPSLLAQSGLLGLQEDDDGGGLFSTVDQEEKEKVEQQRQRQLQQQQQQQQLQQLMEQQRAQEEQRQQQQMFQQQQQQHHLVTSPCYAAPQPPYPQDPSPMMSSAHLVPPQQHLQQQQQQQLQVQAGMQTMTLQPPNQGFYREHPPSVILTGPPLPSNAYGGAAAGAPPHYYYGTQQPPVTPQPNITAGMYNATYAHPHSQAQTQSQLHTPQRVMPPAKLSKITLVKQPELPPLYTQIQVSEPMLIQQQNFLISSAPYWSYQITTQLAPPQQGTWLVRRRFRHVVALEDRLRQTCLGSILPPRPDKHATRALEEASTQQSAEFAMQRSRELAQYLNALAKHPVAGQSQVLRLFLGLQDDIGTAWPEVSGNAFTKLGAVAAGMSMKVAESTQMTAASAPAHEWEEDAELLALSSSENVRMGSVSQAVPKLEGAVTNLREHGDAAGAVGMELSKVSKLPANEDFKVCDVLSHGLLREGRRNKRLAVELSAAMDSFLQQYKMVRYEKMALQDRRQAIQRKGTYRRGADQRAVYLAQQQRQLQASGQYGHLNHLERNAIQTDSMANDVMGEAEEIAARLKSEIHRVAIDRRTQWNASMKTIASAMKEACSERLAIWESTLEALKALPGGMPTENGEIFNGDGSIMVPNAPSGTMAAAEISGGALYQQPTMNASVLMHQNPNPPLDASTIYA